MGFYKNNEFIYYFSPFREIGKEKEGEKLQNKLKIMFFFKSTNLWQIIGF